MDENVEGEKNHKEAETPCVGCAESLAEMEEKWKRSVADYRNLEKRVREEREVLIKFASRLLVTRLLPILDNIERAYKEAPSEGLKLVIKDFRQILADEGVTEITAVGQDFDPNLHEAVEIVVGEEGKVVEVLEKGYYLGNQTVRVAKVTVGRVKED